jgi:lipase chaperone LimK
LAARASAAKAEIEAFMAREQASIRLTMERLEVEEALSKSEATYRARFDASEKGRLMNRYEGEATAVNVLVLL